MSRRESDPRAVIVYLAGCVLVVGLVFAVAVLW